MAGWNDPDLVAALEALNRVNGIEAGAIGSYASLPKSETAAKLCVVINADGGLRDVGSTIARTPAELAAMIRAFRRGLVAGRVQD
jgi:isopentenyl diphosphate isomerase/L-lactate dehydrogenase-like FMN-dependent dehydrogenase